MKLDGEHSLQEEKQLLKQRIQEMNVKHSHFSLILQVIIGHSEKKAQRTI